MDKTIIVAIIAFFGTLLASGTVTAVTQYVLNKKAKKEEKEDKTAEGLQKLNQRMDSFDFRIEEIDEKIDRNEAKKARTQILRFADELYNGIRHTKEHFNEIMDTCEEYNRYCEDHPDFKNMRTMNAQERIYEIYKKCENEHSFLEYRRKSS